MVVESLSVESVGRLAGDDGWTLITRVVMSSLSDEVVPDKVGGEIGGWRRWDDAGNKAATGRFGSERQGAVKTPGQGT